MGCLHIVIFAHILLEPHPPVSRCLFRAFANETSPYICDFVSYIAACYRHAPPSHTP